MAEKAIWLDIAQVCSRIFTTRRRVKIQHKSFRWDRGGHLPPLGFGLPPTLDMLFHNSSLYKSFNDTINGKLCLCQDSPRFHQIGMVQNQNFLGSMPLVCRTLCTQIRTCLPPPPIIHTISFPPPLGKKLKKKKHLHICMLPSQPSNYYTPL